MTHLISVCICIEEEVKKQWGYHIADGEWTLHGLFEKIVRGECTSDGFSQVL
jgi:hypothetical protein